MVVLLLRTMTLWGNPYQSAGVWAREHPTSSRAVQNLATFYQRFGRFDVAAKIIIDNYRLKPRDGGLALQTAITQCFIADRDLRDSLIAQVTREAPHLDFSPVAALTLHKMIDLHLQGKCNSFRPDDVIGIGRGLLHNPGYAHPDQRYAVLFAVARALEIGGDKEQAMATKRQAFRVAPNIQAAKTIFFELQAAGRGQEAAGFLREARARAPRFSGDYDTWERAAQVGSAAPAAIKKSLDRPSVGEGERRDDSFVTVGNGEGRRSFQ
jgi:tetratricopeptide (TPR) repeat protein